MYLNLGLESFIGTPVVVNGELYGTLNFSDTSPRSQGFSAEEIFLIELMARDLGNAIASVQAQRAIELSQRRFRSTFEQAAVGMAHVSPEGEFIKVNQRLCEIVDYKNDVLLHKTFQEITYPEDLDLDLQYFEQLAVGEINSYSLEKRYIRRDDAIIWVNITVSLIRNSLGEPDYFIAAIEDIGDRKQTELALEQNRYELELANQAKDKFIAHMSHELRTPLNSIIGFSHLLKQDDGFTQQQLRTIDLVHQSGQHLLTLINDVLHLSKLNADKLELHYCDFNLMHLLHNITAMFQISAREKGVNFAVQIAADLPEIVNTDETRLRQVLLNLLSNAFKFTERGTVTLSVALSLDKAVEGRRICFEVRDTGKGIAPDDYQTVFAPFEQLDNRENSADGTGLGLSICQNILQIMNSKLHLDSKIGEGSRFWFELDLTNTAMSLPSVNSAVPLRRQLATPQKVLIIDDNQDNRFLLLQFLEPLGFTIEQADNGLAGIAIAEDFQPDVILIDLLMPGINGKETIERLRQQPQFEKTIILMISANIQLIIDSSDIRCDGFLAKPIDLERLLELLTIHLVLEWEIETPQSVESDLLLTPAESELVRLLELVDFGDMESLLDRINSLADRDSQYIPFVREIRNLADSCQQDKLEKLLKTYIQQK